MKQPKEEGEGEVPGGADGEWPGLDGEVGAGNRGDEARDVGHRPRKKRGEVVDMRGKPV